MGKVINKNVIDVELYSIVKFVDEYEDFDSDVYYKVIDIVDDMITVVVFDKELIGLTTAKDIKSFYKNNMYDFEVGTKFNYYGKKLFEFELKEEKKKKDFELKEEKKKKDLEQKKQRLQEKNNASKLAMFKSDEETLHKMFDKFFEEEKYKAFSLFENMVQKEADKLKKNGIAFKVEYKNLTISEIAKISWKELSKEGWGFCFELDSRMYFQRLR